MSVRKDLGMVTAYAYAVSKGYTGTEEEFAELMADYADVGERAEAAATAAATSATAASGSASDSAASATAAEGFAGNASTSAGTASQAAQNASQSATAASGSATAAAGSATAAAGSATTAGNKATEAAQSATQAAASATTAGTAATNAQAAQTAAETAQTAAEDAQAAAEAAAQTLVIDPTLTQANQAAEAKATGDAIDAVNVQLGAALIVNEASGAIATFADGSDGVPVEGLMVQIEPIQSGTGDPSPENVRPISGRQSVTVWRSGVNVWDEEWEVGTINSTNGETSYDGTRIRSKNFIPCLPSTKYYVIDPTSGDNIRLYFYDASQNFLYVSGFIGNITFTTHSDAYFMKFIVAASYGTTYNHDISINYPSTDHDYHPGTVASVEVQLGQTVYGGRLDVTTGVLTVDRAMVDMGTLTWSYEAKYYTFMSTNHKEMKFNSIPVCSQYKGYSGISVINLPDFGMLIGNSQVYPIIRVKDNRYTDAATFKTAMSGVQLVYELAQPVTVQLSAEQLTTVLGTNNVWSDADSVTVDYVADTKLYIQKAISAAVAALS